MISAQFRANHSPLWPQETRFAANSESGRYSVDYVLLETRQMLKGASRTKRAHSRYARSVGEVRDHRDQSDNEKRDDADKDFPVFVPLE